jgi:hypothetical protein
MPLWDSVVLVMNEALLLQAALRFLSDLYSVQVCFCRDKQSINKFVMGSVSAAGVSMSEPFAVPTEWNFKLMQNPTAFCTGAW